MFKNKINFLLTIVFFGAMFFHAAQTFGQTCAPPPSGIVAWYPGEGNANDIQGGNNGTINGTVSFVAAKVGQGFQTGADSFVRVPSAPSLRPNIVSAELWVRATSPGIYKYPLGVVRGYNGADRSIASYAFYTGPSGGLVFYVSTPSDPTGTVSPNAGTQIWDGQLHHIAGTYDGSRVRLYVDGREIGFGVSASGDVLYDNTYENGDLFIGSYNTTDSRFPFPGTTDEVSIYNRALTQPEIQSIFNAGSAGKCKTAVMPTPTPTPTPNTPAGGSVTVTSGNARVTFAQVTSAGNTTFTPINPPSSAGTPPRGYTILDDAPAYDITTTAVYTPPVTVCFTVSSITTQAEFSRARILHGENGQLIDRTILAPDSPAPDFATRKVCARVNSLSPFVAALAPTAPTAASVSVGGRVTTASGRGISKATVSVTDGSGNVLTTATNSFGYYNFAELPAGETYIFSVRAKRYQFAQPSQVLSINDEQNDVNFTAFPEQREFR